MVRLVMQERAEEVYYNKYTCYHSLFLCLYKLHWLPVSLRNSSTSYSTLLPLVYANYGLCCLTIHSCCIVLGYLMYCVLSTNTRY